MPAWLDGYEHVQITGCTGPGTYVDGYSWRWVAHTTESGAGSMDGIISLFKSNPCSTPHFAVDPATGRKVQFIPIDWSAAALRGGRGGYETNRGHAVQTEIIGYAQDQQNRSQAELRFLGAHLADINAALGGAINLGHVHPVAGPAGYGEGGAVRMTPDTWRAFDGVCGHSAVPFNDHWDPGLLDLVTIARYAGATTPEDDMTPEQDARLKKVEKTLDALMVQIDPQGVAAGQQFNPKKPFLRDLVERVVNKTGA